MDTWVIFADPPHPEAAHAFLNFIHEPEIQAKETVTNGYATPNDEAKKLVPQEILDDPTDLRSRVESSTRAARGGAGPVDRPDPGRRSGRSSSRRSAAEVRPLTAEHPRPMTTAAPALERQPAPPPDASRARLLTGLLVLPAGLWYLVLLVLPIAIVVLFSFGERSRTGGYAGGFTLENYGTILRTPEAFTTSLSLSIFGTLLCLLIGLPLAYFIADAGGQPQGAVHRAARDPVLDELPHPDLRLADDPRPGGTGGVHRRHDRQPGTSGSWAPSSGSSSGSCTAICRSWSSRCT